MPVLKKMPLQIAVAVDQLLNTLCGGWADETLSSRAWRLSGQGRGWSLARRMIDGLFFWQESHCRTSYNNELERKHLPVIQRGIPERDTA